MIVLLDNGHGGLINGEYVTPGKRSPAWSDGSQLFEGEFNRAIVNGIIEELTLLQIPYVNICPEMRDVTLETRVNRANDWADEDCFYLSIHSNAAEDPSVNGFEVYTYFGESKSDQIATIFGETYQDFFPGFPIRTDFSDDDLDKEENFYVLRKTAMPAILNENFFMTNEAECRNILLTREGRRKIINFHVEAIVRVKLGNVF